MAQGYSVETKANDAKVYAKGVSISFIHAATLSRVFRGMRYTKAINMLQGLSDETISLKGKYYTKTVNGLIPIFKSAEANAKAKGLDVSKLFVYHFASQKGSTVYRPTRMRFKKGAWRMHNTHIELVLRESSMETRTSKKPEAKA